MIEMKRGSILIEGRPVLLVGGEIHYYRVPRNSWESRLDLLKKTGANLVSSYVPWLCHQPDDGPVDLVGRTRAELDLFGFIDLCREKGLWFFVRPGPFIMAEMKNEGLPYWIYQKHPEIVPYGWDGKPTGSRSVDYLAPAFLEETRKWYRAVMPGIATRLEPNGGNIIGVQLDNEIGMLSWLANSPDLSDQALDEFAGWLHDRYPGSGLTARYPFTATDAATGFKAFRHAVLSPREGDAIPLWNDLSDFLRDRYVLYVAALRGFAEENGVKGVPFVINVHGCSGARAMTYPIGLSQLQRTYAESSGYLVGSDLYLGDVSRNSFQDQYLAHALTKATIPAGQPFSCVEFEAGDGDYGQVNGGYDSSATDLKMRMAVAQGNRLLNLYLFSGGYNYRLDPGPGDGNDRVAFTGERHGFAAPVTPEGTPGRSYRRTSRGISALAAVGDLLADGDEEHDDLVYGYIPDDFATENRYPGNEPLLEHQSRLERGRAGWAWDSPIRALLLAGYRFPALDLSRGLPSPGRVLLLPSGPIMAAELQRRLVEHLLGGGRILLLGEVPTLDRDGMPCMLLADALSTRPEPVVTDGNFFFLSVVPVGAAAPRAESRLTRAQPHRLHGPASPLLRIYPDGLACAFETTVGKGKAIAVTADHIGDVDLYRTLAMRLGAIPRLSHDEPTLGLWMTTTRLPEGGRLLHAINLDGEAKRFHVFLDGRRRFGGLAIEIGPHEGRILPLRVRLGADRPAGYRTEGPQGVVVAYSTVEFSSIGRRTLSFALGQGGGRVVLRTDRALSAEPAATLVRKGSLVTVTWPEGIVHVNARRERTGILRFC